MILKINRFKEIDDGTIGKFELISNDKTLLKGFTLEPRGSDETKPNLDKRIPAGSYDIMWHNSPKFKRVLPLLFNELVAKSRHILIHAGNYPKDTQGCILIGFKYDEKGVYESKNALNTFLSLVKGIDFKVVIRNDSH